LLLLLRLRVLCLHLRQVRAVIVRVLLRHCLLLLLLL
jgi:hypothetical protein